MHYYTSFPEILQRISVHYFLVCLDIFHIVFYQKIVERYTILGESFKFARSSSTSNTSSGLKYLSLFLSKYVLVTFTFCILIHLPI